MYIFDEADCITPQAQNALLKIIEEPPAGVYMLLLCENSLSLLSTVRSRAQRITLERFEPSALRAYAERYGLTAPEEGEKLSFAVRMAGGSIGRLKTLLDEDSFAFSVYSTAKRIVEGQAAKNRGVSYFDFLRLITDFVTTREALDALTENLLLAYGDLARIKNAEESASLFFDGDEEESLAMQFAMESVAKSFAAADAVRADMKWNTGVAVSAAVLAMDLWAAA
jgi:DNA polymerase III delta prime subunit